MKPTLCGDNCEACPRYLAKTDEELRRTAELWHKVGWREKVVSNDEIRCEGCTGCAADKQCTYRLVECTEEHGVSVCRGCEEFPCGKISDMLKRSAEYERVCEKVCTDAELEQLKAAFFNKEENLGIRGGTMSRTAQVSRETKETNIAVELDLDGGKVNVKTGIGFLDHMLTALGTHGGFGLSLEAKGDLYVDGHHTAEDVGIVLGKAFAEALGDKSGIVRYGSAYIPMDEALAFCALDISARPFLVFNAEFTNERVGEFDTCLTEEFMRAFAFNAGITLHLRAEYGSNDHHKIEALFKALAYALKAATRPNNGEVVSTKGVL